jgi:hypothetical protein
MTGKCGKLLFNGRSVGSLLALNMRCDFLKSRLYLQTKYMKIHSLRHTQLVVFTSLLLLLTCFFSCRKAGTGGKAEVAVFVKHHGNLIPRATVYVKFNEKEFPGTDVSKYNISKICGTIGGSKGHTHLDGLKQGYYYFYSLGYDSAISQSVSGGISLHIKYKQRKENITLDIPVTE